MADPHLQPIGRRLNSGGICKYRQPIVFQLTCSIGNSWRMFTSKFKWRKLKQCRIFSVAFLIPVIYGAWCLASTLPFPSPHLLSRNTLHDLLKNVSVREILVIICDQTWSFGYSVDPMNKTLQDFLLNFYNIHVEILLTLSVFIMNQYRTHQTSIVDWRGQDFKMKYKRELQPLGKQ